MPHREQPAATGRGGFGAVATLTVVVAARDEEAMLPGCLRRLNFADEVIVAVDDRTVDGSAAVASAAGATVLRQHFMDFAQFKNAAIERATSDWVFVVDADERVSRALAAEIAVQLDGPADGMRVRMHNYFHGQLMRWGGWQERPLRLWRVGMARYSGEIHERPVFAGLEPRIIDLDSPLVHLSHRSVPDNLAKSMHYVEVDSRARLRRGDPPVTVRSMLWRVVREVGFRLILRRGWRDGPAGVYEALYWPLSHLSADMRLWELQQAPSVEERYGTLEDGTW